MNYFLDTEFNEGMKKPLFGKPYHTVELISIGIVAEDCRKYYAISNEFNIKSAWDKHNIKSVRQGENYYREEKEYWLRNNVLHPIWYELREKDKQNTFLDFFTYKDFKRLVKKYGKTAKEIASEVISFTQPYKKQYYNSMEQVRRVHNIYKEGDSSCGLNFMEELFINGEVPHPTFFGYFADYDWVIFCALFGRMIDLPKGFPMYCRDLKQMVDETAEKLMLQGTGHSSEIGKSYPAKNIKYAIAYIKNDNLYPKQSNEHNALADAQWNLDLHTFILAYRNVLGLN